MSLFTVFPFVACLLLDAEVFGCGFERDTVNRLFGKLDFVEPDPALAISGALLCDVKPILLLDGVASPFVVPGGVRLRGLLFRGVVERLAHDHTARGAGGGGYRISVREFVADVSPASGSTNVGDCVCGRAAAEQQRNGNREKDDVEVHTSV